MIVSEGPAPSFNVDPNFLDFETTTEQLSFDIQNVGDAALNWDISANQNWILYILQVVLLIPLN